MSETPAKMEFVTVFDDCLEVYAYSSPNKTVCNFKSDHFPSNEFVLKARNNDSSTVYFVLNVKGPEIQDPCVVKVSKRDINAISFCPSDDLASKELKLEKGQKNLFWHFSSAQRYQEHETNREVRTLWLKIEIGVPSEKANVTNSSDEEDEDEEEETELVKSYRALFNNEVYSDFKICVQDKTFYVSKAILAVESKFFRSKFVELFSKQENTLVIEEFDEDVVETMLKYAYTQHECLGSDTVFIEKLIVAAAKFELKDLKEECEEILLDNVDSSTAVKYFVIGDKHGCNELRQKCIDYLKNKFPEIRQNEEFKSLLVTHPHLAVEICFAVNGFKDA